MKLTYTSFCHRGSLGKLTRNPFYRQSLGSRDGPVMRRLITVHSCGRRVRDRACMRGITTHTCIDINMESILGPAAPPPPLGWPGGLRCEGQRGRAAKVITREELRQASGRPFGRGAALSTQATLGCLPGLRHRPPERSHCCGVSAREEARDNGRELIETRFVNHPRAITQGRMPVVAAAADTCALCYTDRTGPGSQRRMSARLRRSSRPLQTARQPFSRRKTGLRKRATLSIHNP